MKKGDRFGLRAPGSALVLVLAVGCSHSARPVNTPSNEPVAPVSAVPERSHTAAAAPPPVVGDTPAPTHDDQKVRKVGVMDPAFMHLAEATGGSVMDGRQPAVPGTPLKNAADMLSGPVIVVLARGERTVAAEPIEIPFLVDSSLGRFDARIRLPPGGKAELLAPDGHVLGPSPGQAATLEYGVDKPARGSYRLRLLGASPSEYGFEVQGSSQLGKVVKLSEQRALLTEDGLPRLVGRPLAGDHYVIDLKLALNTPAGVVTEGFSDLHLIETAPDLQETRRVTVYNRISHTQQSGFDLKARSQVVLHGRLPDGSEFAHVLSSISATPFGLKGYSSRRAFPRGEPTVVTLRVENRGPDAKLVFDTASASGVKVSFEPATLQLRAGGKATVLAQVEPTADSGELSAVVRVGSGPKDPDANLWAFVGQVSDDSDRDGVPDAVERQGTDVDRKDKPEAEDSSVAGFGLGVRHVGLVLPAGMRVEGFEYLSALDIEHQNSEQPSYGGLLVRLAGHARPPAQWSLHVPGRKDLEFALVPPTSGTGPWVRRGVVDKQRDLLTVPLTRGEQKAFASGHVVLRIAPAYGR